MSSCWSEEPLSAVCVACPHYDEDPHKLHPPLCAHSPHLCAVLLPVSGCGLRWVSFHLLVPNLGPLKSRDLKLVLKLQRWHGCRQCDTLIKTCVNYGPGFLICWFMWPWWTWRQVALYLEWLPVFLKTTSVQFLCIMQYASPICKPAF